MWVFAAPTGAAGAAREKVFTHRHEIESGRTSVLTLFVSGSYHLQVKSEHIMGFDKNKQAVYQNANFNTSAVTGHHFASSRSDC